MENRKILTERLELIQVKNDMVKPLLKDKEKGLEIMGLRANKLWPTKDTLDVLGFLYGILDGDTDDDQWFSFISTKVVASVGYQIPGFEYENSGGTWIVIPTVQQGSRTIYATPSIYDSINSAVMAYRDPYSYPSRTTVDYIDISGAESKEVETI